MSKTIYIIAIICIVSVVYILNYRPTYNWDILPYMAIVLENECSSNEELHEKVYSTILYAEQDQKIPSGTFSNLTERIPYRVDAYNNVDKFIHSLIFYKTKPLYTNTVRLLYKFKVPIIQATYIPSLISAFFILIVVFIWLSSFTNSKVSLIFTLLLSQLSIFKEVANNSAPDAMSALFVLSTLYLFHKGCKNSSILFQLLLSITTRIDNFILALPIAYHRLVKTKKDLIKYLLTVVLTASTCIVLLPMLSGNDLDWFYNFKFMESHVQYYFHVRNVFRELMIQKHLWVYIICGVGMMFLGNSKTRSTCKVVLTVILVRLILFPSLQERFFVAYEFVILILLVQFIKETAIPFIYNTSDT